ncbi:MAG TPA: hypothetical protein GX497_03440 [Bacillus bacterium]|nr:hypothetical protein [Bacillus sp. (in: firmicutes)]
MFFNRKKKDEIFPETNDILIIFDDEKKTSEIHRINEFTEESAIVTGKYNVPILDCEITNSDEGRNFFYRAPSQMVEETKRLAQLEKSIVLTQITNYKPVEDTQKGDLTKLFLIITIMLAFIVFGISSCSGGA